MSQDTLNRIYFASSSRNKFEDYQFLLGQYADLRWARAIVDEPKTIDFSILIRRKIEGVRSLLPHLPFIVEQSGLVIQVWRVLPGTLTDLFMDDIGNEGICKMMEMYPDDRDRMATAITDLGYHGPDGRVQVFRGQLEGRIAREPRGENGFGWDAIFVPEGHDETFAEMSLEKKLNISTRMLAVTNFYRAVLDDGQATEVAQNRIQLRKLIVRHFNKTELEDLCFILGIDPEEALPDAVKRDQVRELILYCDRHSFTPDLLRACKAERPNADWPDFA